MKRAITVILSIFLIFTALPVLTFAGDNFLESLSHSNAIDSLLNGNNESAQTPDAPEAEQAPETLSLPFSNSLSQIIEQLNSYNAAAPAEPETTAPAPAEPATEAPAEPETQAPAPTEPATEAPTEPETTTPAEPELSPEEYELEKVSDLLVCLGDKPEMTDTMLAFYNGDTVSYNDNSELAKGLQQTLVELGCDIAVDGSAGPGTFGALNSLLKNTGLITEDINTVDTDIYWDLLAIYLIENQEDDAYNMLSDYFEITENSDQLQYIKAGLYYNQERYYSAMETFYDSHYGDWQDRLAACEQPWPATGELWHNDYYYSSEMSLTFDVNWGNEQEAHYYMVFDTDGTLASLLFVSGSGSATTFLPGGTYKIRSAVGDTWYGTKDAFGKLGFYEFLRFDEDESDPYLTYLDAGYGWTITINAAEYDPSSTNVGALDSSWEDWILP